MSALTPERLEEIRAIRDAADPGPWRWHGNTDSPEGLSLENGEWVLLGITRRDRTPDDRQILGYAEWLRECEEFVSREEEEALDPDDPDAADRLRHERSLAKAREEMLTDQWGNPAHDVRLRFGGDDRTTAGLAEDLAVYQVARNQGLPDDTPRDHPKVYRADIVGFRNPNATFIAASRKAVDDLLAEVDRLRDLLAAGIEAFRLTKEYVNTPDKYGFVLLPDVEGWSHFDWTERARAELALITPEAKA